MEKTLFSWNDWDQLDTMAFIFYGATLVRDIGKFKTGTSFDYASIDYGNGKLTLAEDACGGVTHTFNIAFGELIEAHP